MKKRILIVDDDPRITSLIKDSLHQHDFSVLTAADAAQAIEKANQSLPDLIILDIVIPGMCGWDICRTLKSDSRTRGIPIIFITGTSIHPEDKIKGLEIGAFDYVTKPFHSEELVARVKAILRRHEMTRAATAETAAGAALKTGGISIDLNNKRATAGEKHIKLRPMEFEVLAALVKNKGKVLSRRYLMESLWGKEFDGNSRAVDITIRRLRKKLGKYSSKLQTVQSMGYKLDED